MKRLLSAVAATAALLAPGAAYGQATEIATGDDFFAPRAVTSTVGASFHWAWGPPGSTNEHNVRQDDKLFYSGPLAVSDEFSLTPSAGSFHYYCDLHGFDSGGMDGVLKIKPTATVSGNRATITWATATTDSGRQFDVRQKVGKKKPKLVRQATSSTAGTFKLNPGAKYQFQARSRQGKAASDWSPKLRLKG